MTRSYLIVICGLRKSRKYRPKPTNNTAARISNLIIKTLKFSYFLRVGSFMMIHSVIRIR